MVRSSKISYAAGFAISVLACAGGQTRHSEPLATSAQPKPLPAQLDAAASEPTVSPSRDAPKVGTDVTSPPVDKGATLAEPEAVATDVSNGSPLLIWLKRPYAPNAKKLVSVTKLRFYGNAKDGSLYTYVTEAQLKSIFGLSIRSWTDRGAGNSIGSDAHHFEIENKKLLKPNIKVLLSDIELRDDPKWGLYEQGEEYRPE